MGRLVWIGVLALLAMDTAVASEALTPGPEARGQQVMLYLKRPLGAVSHAGRSLALWRGYSAPSEALQPEALSSTARQPDAHR